MNWDDLRLFLAVARTSRLSTAAHILGLDATTVGRRIDRLAAAFGTTLFEVGPAGRVPTKRGAQLLAYAEAMEVAAFAAKSEVAGERTLLTGTVRVSVAEGFGTWIVARHLAAFHCMYPDIVIELVASSGFLNPSKREADVAVMLARPTSGPLFARRLTDYCLGLYAAPTYLSTVPRITSAADLRDHTLIGYVPELLYSPALDYIAEVRPARGADIRSSSINAQTMLAVSGAGLCVLPRFIGEQDDRLVAVLPDDVALTRTFWLVVHRDVRKLVRVSLFITWLVALCDANRLLFLRTRSELHSQRAVCRKKNMAAAERKAISQAMK